MPGGLAERSSEVRHEHRSCCDRYCLRRSFRCKTPESSCQIQIVADRPHSAADMPASKEVSDMSESGATMQPVPGRPGNPQRIRLSHVEWVAERLSDRDWHIVEATNRLRLMSGQHLERLYFAALTGHTRAVVRGRVLRRLVHWQVLTVLPRRVGGAARGSAGATYALGATGAQLCAERPTTPA